MKDLFDFRTVDLVSEDGAPALRILDQTLLPGEVKYLNLNTPESIYDAIYKLRVRGAPAIGVAAGYGLYVLAEKAYREGRPYTSLNDMKNSGNCAGREINPESVTGLIKNIEAIAAYLISSRPTAVNLAWAVNRVKSAALAASSPAVKGLKTADTSEGTDNRFTSGDTSFDQEKGASDLTPARILEIMKAEAAEIHREDVEMCRKIGENGLEVLKPGMGVLTHCNAGALATSGIGTALAPIYTANSRGYDLKVFADETRPLLQGARLTSWELTQAGVDVTLICDNMASTVMKQGKVQAVITGADRIAANGDTANKIGTSGVAILAKEYGIPFYIAAPYSTIDENCKTGADIKIEERPGDEIYRAWYEKPMAPEGVKTFNPAFDVTDHKYITGIITESGIRYL